MTKDIIHNISLNYWTKNCPGSGDNPDQGLILVAASHGVLVKCRMFKLNL